jgi:predicted DNA-binding transcriptional regulator YafY
MNNTNPKKSDTSIRVLETLKILMKKESSVQDIINYFEVSDPHNKTYTSEAILKYINTLKVYKLNIVKNKDKYVLLNLPNQVNLTENELEILNRISEYSETFSEQKVKDDIRKFLNNLAKHYTPETKNLTQFISAKTNEFKSNYKQYEKQILEYEKFCLEGLKLKIVYYQAENAKASIIAEPKSINYESNHIFFKVYNPLIAQIQDINFDSIISVSQLPLKANQSGIITSITFKLYGRLAKGYRLHDGERLLDTNSNGSILIINQAEDKTMLLKRLMRYGALCEVISPKSIRNDMKFMIKDAIAKLE